MPFDIVRNSKNSEFEQLLIEKGAEVNSLERI